MKFLFLLLLLSVPLVAEPLSDQQISERIKANEDNPSAVGVWQDALIASKAATQSVNKERKIRAEIIKLDSLPDLQAPALLPPTATLSDQEALLNNVVALIESNETQLKELDDYVAEAPSRMAELTESLAGTRTELEDLEVPVIGAGELQSAQHQKALQMKNLFEAKLAEIAAEQDLTRQKVESASARVGRRKDHLNGLQELQKTLGERIAALKAKEAEDTRVALAKSAEVFRDVPELSAIVAEVAALNERRSDPAGLRTSLRNAQAYTASIQEIRDRIKEQSENAQRRIELLESAKLGVDDETGLLLRQQRARLPSVDELSLELRENLARAAKAQLAVMALSDRMSSLPVLTDKRIAAIVEKDPQLPAARIEELLTQRSEIFKDLSAEYRSLDSLLTKGTEASKLTISEIEAYSQFIDQRLLWIKSTKPVHLGEPIEEWGRVRALFSPEAFGQIWSSMKSEWLPNIIQTILTFGVALIIFMRRRLLRKTIQQTSEEAARRNCTRIMPTLKNICAAFLLSLWFPLLLVIPAMLIERPVAWHGGLVRVALYLFASGLILNFSRKDGLFVSHLKMHPGRAALINSNIKCLFPFAIPFVFLVTALTNSDVDPSSGRLTFMVAMIVLLGFCHHLFHPKRSILQEEGKSSPCSRAAYFLIMAIPVVFLVGAGLGYFASVLTLRSQVGATIILLLSAFVGIRFLMRWTLVSRRNLAISQALRRREVALAEREREAEGAEKSVELPTLEEVRAEAVDVAEVEEQTSQLLRLATYAAVFFGLWAIWLSTFTALSFLDKVTLWGSSDQAVIQSAKVPSLLPSLNTEPSSPPSDSAPTSVDDRVSLQDLLLSLVFFAITFIGARNIPSLLSLTLFSRIKMGPGGNFALTTTVRYLIVLVGVVMALSQIGITWGKVQWLAAAITLGIGFGLQEIFANFVAGIIMLFERPVRLGDVVTVGEISGRVTQIKIRATTIQQFNNRELLVPNKEFITSQLVNWTLKDSVLRFEIGVGIAYGSDTKEATRILNQILKDHPNVLDEPKPDVLFIGFGNSTLDFNIRGFVTSVEHLIQVQSDLHYRIDDSFREAGIEIAFPQQDIHLRSLPEGMTLTPKS